MVRVAPTLETMAAIYRLSSEGGPRSPRFTTYLAAVRERDGAGLQAFNPMAGAAAAETVELLLRADAEEVARRAAADALRRCGVELDLELAVVVASPGMWTDRLITEAEHRLAPERAVPALIQVWAGEPADVAAEATAEAARAAWNEGYGAPRTVAQTLAREGFAIRLASLAVEPLTPAERAAVDDALEVLGESTARGDVLAVAYGDPLCEALGLSPLGLADRAGVRRYAETASDAMASPSSAHSPSSNSQRSP